MKSNLHFLGIAAMVFVTLFACQREDLNSNPIQEETTENITLDEAKAVFEAQKNEVETQAYKLLPQWETFTQGGRNSNGKPFAYVQVQTTKQTATNLEIVFTKKDNTLIFKIVLTDNLSHKRKKIAVLDYKGNFLHGYVIKNDTIMQVHLQPKPSGLSARTIGRKPGLTLALCNFFNEDDPDDPDSNGGGEGTIHLSPVEVVGYRQKSRGGGSSSTFSFWGHTIPYNYSGAGYFEDDYREKVSIEDLTKSSSGGGSSYAYNETKLDDEIIDNLKNPCAKGLLKQLPNLKNDIAKLLKETFGGDSKYDITFTEDENLRKKGIDGQANASNATKISEDEIIFRSNIYLNPDILENATQEYILVTMYHEVIHAFLNYEETRLRGKILPNGEFDNSEFEHKYPDVKIVELEYGNKNKVKKYQLLQEQGHNRFAPFIEKLAQSIISFNPKIPLKTARAMAKMGIVDEKSMSNEEKLLNQGQRNGTDTKGTKCN